MFHVKQRNELNLLSYAEIAKNHIKNVLDIDLTGQPAQALRRQSELLGDDILASGQDRSAKARKSSALWVKLSAFSMPFSGQKGSIPVEVTICAKSPNCGQQLGDT